MKKILLVLATLGFSAPAFAGYEVCPDGYMCIWGDSNYQGRWQIFNTTQNNIGNFMNDLTTSYWNRTPYRWCAYQNAEFADIQPEILEPWSSSGNIGGYENDVWSSFRPC